MVQISKIFEICNAYESGVGHGNSRDGLSAGPYPDPDLNEAYEYGYQQGEETAVIDEMKKSENINDNTGCGAQDNSNDDCYGQSCDECDDLQQCLREG